MLLLSVFILNGCEAIDKTLAPVDAGINETKLTYTKTKHGASELYNETSEKLDDVTANLYENAVVKIFSDDETIEKNRNEHFVRWRGEYHYELNKLLHSYLRKRHLDLDPDELTASQKMLILKELFFDQAKTEYAKKFVLEHPAPVYDKFLTDRENIDRLYDYKMAIAESEHEWNLHLKQTQKEVAEQMLDALYGKPEISFVSYDPYREEVYLDITSSRGEFEQKIRIESDKENARKIEKEISKLHPTVYFDFDDDVLNFVGVSVNYKGKLYIADITGETYTPQSDIVFVSGKPDLKKFDVEYAEAIQNITPPSWYNSLHESEGEIIAYGQGLDKDEAKTDARKGIAERLRVTIRAKQQLNTQSKGDIAFSNFSKSVTQEIDPVVLKGSRIIKIEKQDGIWFTAVAYKPDNQEQSIPPR